jgi:hypothetical protein
MSMMAADLQRKGVPHPRKMPFKFVHSRRVMVQGEAGWRSFEQPAKAFRSGSMKLQRKFAERRQTTLPREKSCLPQVSARSLHISRVGHYGPAEISSKTSTLENVEQ